MNVTVFFLLLVVVVVPPWLALNCSMFQSPPERPPAPPPTRISTTLGGMTHTKTRTSKSNSTMLNRYKATSGYIWVRDLDMVVTTTGYVWHRDMPNKEVKAGGGTVDMPVRMDRSGVAKGLILSRTKAELQCTATVNETMVYIYIFHSESMGNLHEGLYAMFMALKETGHLNTPFRISFLERWGASNQDYIRMVYPNAVQPSMLLGDIVEHHPIDFKSSTPPQVIDGLCIREIIIMKDQFPIFPPPSKRTLVAYRKYLLGVFGVSQPLEHATRQAATFAVPAEAIRGDDAPPSPDSPPTRPRVILIRRTKDKTILNSDALLQNLRSALQKEADVYQVSMELLTPREVVSLMQGTTVLIGTHGSGLAHLWFLPRTSSMIVIHAPGTDALLSTKSFADGAPWLIDYQTIASKLKMNTFVHKVEKQAESIEDCGAGRWGLYCAYVKNVEVDVDALATLTREAIKAALARKDETFD